jgi:dihydropteroate synthase
MVDRRPLVMGVLNVTPDSFSDGGLYQDVDAAVAHGLRMRDEGADIIDVGGEATNPRAKGVPASEELARVLTVIERLAAAGVTVSVDTVKAEVARAAVAAGARIVNDVAGGRFDPEMVRAITELTARGDVTYILGHLRGRTLSEVFTDEGARTWREVADDLATRLAALPVEVHRHVWVDPGIGFHQSAGADLAIERIRHAGDIARAVGRPIVIGTSRKRFLRRLLEEGMPGREPDTLALDVATVASCLAAMNAGADVLRVHNVALLRAALAVYTKL